MSHSFSSFSSPPPKGYPGGVPLAPPTLSLRSHDVTSPSSLRSEPKAKAGKGGHRLAGGGGSEAKERRLQGPQGHGSDQQVALGSQGVQDSLQVDRAGAADQNYSHHRRLGSQSSLNGTFSDADDGYDGSALLVTLPPASSPLLAPLLQLFRSLGPHKMSMPPFSANYSFISYSSRLGREKALCQDGMLFRDGEDCFLVTVRKTDGLAAADCLAIKSDQHFTTEGQVPKRSDKPKVSAKGGDDDGLFKVLDKDGGWRSFWSFVLD